MFDQEFYNCFTFRQFRFTRPHYTDMTVDPGCPVHYAAQLIHGTAALHSHRGIIRLSPGDYFYIPKGAHYESRWYPDEDGQVAFYSFGFENLPLREGRYRLQRLECTPEEEAVFAALAKDMTVNTLSVGHLYTFMGMVCRHMETSDDHTCPAQVDQAMEFMRRNEHAPAASIADHLGISESGLYSLFRKFLGKTPAQVRQEIRIEHAVSLLVTTDLPVEELSEKLGFSSSSYFRKIFKSLTGKNPLEVRRENRF